jgi:hypothetical protein
MFEDAGYTVDDMQRITVDPFATELEVQEADFPPELNARIREDEDAMTYQFVFPAVPAEGTPRQETVAASGSLTIDALWELHRRAIELYELIEQKDANISDFQGMVAEKDKAVADLRRAIAERDREIARTRRLSVYTVPDTLNRVRRVLESRRQKE